MSEEIGDYVISHVGNHVISGDLYQKGVQTIFFKELINIFNKRQSCKRDIGTKVDNFF